MKTWLMFAISLLAATCSTNRESGQAAVEVDGGVFRKMEVEKLPSLNHSRGGHAVLCINGEPTVFGGHTDGFVRENTAEYFKDGKWTEIQMHYPHDFGFAARLPDGNVMLGGGAAENFGIGQSWGVEVYDPKTHTFKATGVLDSKRAGASAMSFENGRVIVSGNWYRDDCIEEYIPGRGFSLVKPVTVHRSKPHILQTDSSNAIIFASEDIRGKEIAGCVDRLIGEPFEVPLLEEYLVFNHDCFQENSIGDYTHLIRAKRKADGQDVIMKVAGEHFSILDMERPIPSQGIGGDKIGWSYKIKINRKKRNATLFGAGGGNYFYIAQINYDATLDGGKASLELFYADNQGDCYITDNSWDMMEDGRIILCGGVTAEKKGDSIVQDNFRTSQDVYVFSTQPQVKPATSPWLWFCSGILVVAGCIFLVYRLLARKSGEEEDIGTSEAAKKSHQELQEQISKLIEEKELFKKKDIRLSDIASELATNRTYVSLIINSSLGTSFSDLINSYRIEHAKKLMAEQPKMSHSDIAEQSGFSSRTSFLRTFKAKTGMSPKEWKESNR